MANVPRFRIEQVNALFEQAGSDYRALPQDRLEDIIGAMLAAVLDRLDAVEKRGNDGEARNQ